MKKLLIAALASLVTIAGAYAQSADEKDVAKLTAKLAETKAENWWQTGELQVKIALAKLGTPKTFAEFKAAVQAGADAVKTFPSDVSKQNFVDDQIAGKGRWWYKCALMKDAYAYVKTLNKPSCLRHFVIWYDSRLGLAEEDLYAQTMTVVTKCSLSSVAAMRAVSQIVKLGAVMDEATIKADLKKLNRLYSPYLIKDKAAWEPVVATIRTALETY